MAKSKTLKQHTYVEALKIWCETLQKNVVIKDFQFDIEIRDDGCETCGFGKTDRRVITIARCKCGKPHEINIE